ncbi:MAG: prolipoprotein diacylglyceryl transferase [Planctomycetaceae bacterium]|nr:prolipoprotein diacylglyceryl transferase [Planctomycetaceae bacterium]MCB9952407.1 prolipoprotein diacylglyceryl transferase [Planctomycetaceae bacterium]
MRQVLFEVWLKQPWAGWTPQQEGVELLGAGWVVLLLGLLYGAYQFFTGHKKEVLAASSWGTFLGILLGVTLVGPNLPIDRFPIFGYGVMVLIGFLFAIAFAQYRSKQVGQDPEIITDLAFWILVCGIAGGRIAYLVQYRSELMASSKDISQLLFNAVNLSNGGLVLIGAMFGAAIGFFSFCHIRKIPPLPLVDIITPSIFIGVGFGRIGCLLNGCCFGDRCDLPWGICFPHGSTTFDVLAIRGFVEPTAPYTMPLHPTQVYSSINGFVLALVTAQMYWYRRHPGDTFALGCILYPMTRILLEFIRADEMGQFGTSFTISQWYSVGILCFGIGLLLRNRWQHAGTRSPSAAS